MHLHKKHFPQSLWYFKINFLNSSRTSTTMSEVIWILNLKTMFRTTNKQAQESETERTEIIKYHVTKAY